MSASPAVNILVQSLILGTDDKGRTVSLPVKPTEKLAIIGLSGSGKSYAAGVMVEQWLKAGVPVAVIDIVGIWAGLRSGADGGAEGGLPIPVYGGMLGDAEVPSAIAAAQSFSLKSQSAVFDLSELRMEDIQLWVAEFAEELMAPGCSPVKPCRVVLEEAPALAPQSGSLSKHQRRCKAALAHFTRVGRNRGYGIDLISQRAQSISKDLLTQCSSLLLLRLSASLDRKTITEWVASNSAEIDTKKVLAYLAEAENGEGMLWAPTWLKDRPRDQRYLKVKVGKRTTFHIGPEEKPTELLSITMPDMGVAIAGDGLEAIGKIITFLIKAALVLAGIWLAWKILSVVAAVVGLALLLWIVFGK